MSALSRCGIAALGVLLVSVQLVCCKGPVAPSRGLVVALTEPGPSAIDVEGVIAKELQKEGFRDAGMDGRDTIRNLRTSFYFSGRDDISVFVEVDLKGKVPVRVSQYTSTFSAEANQLFERLAVALEAKWPGTVTLEPLRPN